MLLLFVLVRYKLVNHSRWCIKYIYTNTDNVASVEQFIGRNRCDESITHLFLSIDRPLIKATNDDIKDRYYNRLIESRLKAWTQMNIQKWIKRLEKLGEVILTDELINASHFGNVSLNKSCEQNNTIDNPQSGFRSNDSGIKDSLELAHNGTNTLDTRTMTGKRATNWFNETQFNGKVLNIRFNGKKKLYEYYGTKSFPSPYEIVMSKNAIKNGKRARMYALAYKGTSTLTIHTQTLQTNESGIVEYNNKPLNIEFNGIKQLKDYYKYKIYTIYTTTSND